MAKFVRITSIRITSDKKDKILTKNEIEKFCAERVKISVTEIKQCRVFLNKLTSTYIQNALRGQIDDDKRKSNVESVPKVINIFIDTFLIF